MLQYAIIIIAAYKKQPKRTSYMIYLIIILAILILDRITKLLILANFQLYGTLPIWQNVFHLTYTQNTGAAFSIFRGNPYLLAGFSALIIALMIFFFFKQKKKNKNKFWFLASMCFIIGGAIGNLIDRIYYGYVIDFFDFRLINFAVFNVADSFITVGAIIFCICLLFDKSIKI